MSFLKNYQYQLLLLYHLAFAAIAWYLVKDAPADAHKYCFHYVEMTNIHWSDFLKPGTDFLQFCTFPLVKYLHLPFWSGFLIFNIISGIGFYFLLKILEEQTNFNTNFYIKSLVFTLILLPNLHFWASNIGKESPIFLLMVLLLRQILKNRIFNLPFLVLFLLLALFRPHVAFVFLLSLVIALFWKSTLNSVKKWMVLAGFIVLVVVLYFLLAQIANLGENPVASLVRIYHRHIAVFRTTPSYVPLDEYNLLYKFFTFYFRPLLFEQQDWRYQILGVENVILLILVVIAMLLIIKNFKKIQWSVFWIFGILFLFFFGLMYVFAYANFGIIVRTKTMAIPILYVLLVQLYSVIFNNQKFN